MKRGIRGIIGVVILIGCAWFLYNWLMNDVIFISVVQACPRMIRDAIVLSTIIALGVLVDRVRRNSSVGGLILGLGMGLPVLLLLPVIGLTALGGENGFVRSSSYCPDCRAPAEVRELREQGMLAAAEERALKFLKDELRRNEGGYDLVTDERCIADGKEELANVYLDKGDKKSAELDELKFNNDTDYQVCSDTVADARTYLADASRYALQAAETHNKIDGLRHSSPGGVVSDFEQMIIKSGQNLDLKSKLCIPPVKDARITFEPDDQQVKGDMASVHIKMFTDGKKTTGAANLLEIRQMDNTVVPVDVKEIIASTPLCMLFLADNSGSLIDSTQNPAGIEPVREAVRTLNAVRKEGDYVGMVTFGSQVDVSTAQPLGFDPLNTDLINGRSGNTAIWDAFDYGLKRMTDECKVDKRYLILMTDGLDTASEYLKNVEYQAADGDTEIEKKLKQLEATVTQMRERAMAANIDVFIIAVGSGGKDPDQKAAFMKLASEQRYYEVGFVGLAQQLKDIFGYQEDHYFVEFDAKYLGTDQKIKVGLKTGNTEVIIDFSKP